jgi:antirestriction protein ArdC
MKVEQAKQIVAGVLEQLALALERGQSETLNAYLAAMGRFHRYSLNNVLLIAMQKPGATRVAGFHTWRRLGRFVRRGERGIAILAPVVRRRRDKVPRGEHETEVDKRSDTETAADVVAFRGAYVFDVSQTDGEPLPELSSVDGDPGNHVERLRAFVIKRGITLQYSRRIAPAQGASSGGTITLLPGMVPAEEFSVLVHELAHELLHKREERAELTRTVRETEAEAVAYAVCQAIGLESRNSSADYIHLYNGDAKALGTSLERIRSVAVEVIRAVSQPSAETAGTQCVSEPIAARKLAA